MALTDTFVRQTKHSGKQPGDKYADGGGLNLFVTAAGKYWRLSYRFDGKQKTLALGVYPDTTLAVARKRRDEARAQLADGTDPGLLKKAAKEKSSKADTETFEAIARQWLQKTSARRGPKTQSRVQSWLERDIFPAIGAKQITSLRPRDILGALAKIEARGALDSAKRVLGYCGQVFEYAMLIEACQVNVTAGLYRALEEPEQKHYAAITDPAKVGALLRAIDAYEGHPYVQAALKLAPLWFVRPGELRTAEWAEIDLNTATWSIPGMKMKMGADHIVPLATQALDILRDLSRITGSGRYVFPSIRTAQRPMSENTVNSALRAMGFSKEVMTGHGFRAMARTIMDEELGERVDLIEHQLAHQVKDVNGRAYNRTAHLVARREMMQRWADYLTGCKEERAT